MSVHMASLAGQMTTVYGPASSRRDPLSGAEAAQVVTWRARGLGWDACAKMVGRSTPDVRAHCDPNYRRPYAPAQPVFRPATPAPRPKAVEAPPRDPQLTRPRRMVLDALRRGLSTSQAIGEAVGARTAFAGNVLNKLEGLGWAAKTGGSWRGGFTWAATEAGLKALAEGSARG